MARCYYEFRLLKMAGFQPKRQKDWKIEGKKRRITREEYKRLMNEFELEGLMERKGFWNLAREKRLQERGAIIEEEGDVIREYSAENFPSSWLREDLVEKEERRKKVKERVREEEEEEEGTKEKRKKRKGKEMERKKRTKR